MTCVLVGNGTSLLDSEKGSVIDSYDCVVRFNQFKLASFEKFTGTKTTFWFNTQYEWPSSERMLREYSRFYWHSWHWEEECDRFNSCWSSVKAEKKLKTSKETLKEMEGFLDKDYWYFSTGAIASWLMLKEFEKVSLIGFDWWNRDDHHYCDSQKRGSLHCPQKEFEFFKKLGSRVAFL